MGGMKTLYVFGNDYLPSDNFAIAVAKQLRDVRVVHCRSPEELLEAEGDDILILDVVANTKKPVCITDPQRLKSRNITSMHDFDVAYFLKLSESLGIGKAVRIIGVPPQGDAERVATEVQPWI